MKRKYIALGTVAIVCCLILSAFASNKNIDATIGEEANETVKFTNADEIPLIENSIGMMLEEVTSEPVESFHPIIEQSLPIDKPTWTEEELEYLACAIYQEAGADYISDDTRLKVGCVIMNRVEHELYPDTLFEVLTEYKQYGRFYWTGIIWPKRADDVVEAHAVQRAYDIAERVLNGERLLDKDYIYQAEFIQSNEYILQDGFYFCRYFK